MKLLLDFCLVLRDSVFVLSMRCSLIFFFLDLAKWNILVHWIMNCLVRC